MTGNTTIKKNIYYDDGSVVNGNATYRTKSIVYSKINLTGMGQESMSQIPVKYEYIYDENGNITNFKSYLNNTVFEEYDYEYDSLNQLSRENHFSYKNSYTMVYSYDNYGNITLKQNTIIYHDTPTDNLTEGTVISFKYNSPTEWKDQLTNVGSTSITYDTSGNPIYMGTIDKSQFNFDG